MRTLVAALIGVVAFGGGVMLGPPSRLFPAGSGYLGWRAGIAPAGTWVFFVAGD